MGSCSVENKRIGKYNKEIRRIQKKLEAETRPGTRRYLQSIIDLDKAIIRTIKKEC